MLSRRPRTPVWLSLPRWRSCIWRSRKLCKHLKKNELMRCLKEKAKVKERGTRRRTRCLCSMHLSQCSSPWWSHRLKWRHQPLWSTVMCWCPSMPPLWPIFVTTSWKMCLAAWKRKAKGLTSRVANSPKGTRMLSDLKNGVEKKLLW